MSREREFGINADAFRNAAKALEKEGFDRAAGRTVAFGLRKAANAVRRGVRAEARRHRKTGKLNSGVRTYFKGIGLNFEARVKTTGPVAHLIVGGVTPHPIAGPPYGRGNSQVMALHASGKAGALIGFAKVVQHPGFKADPYFHNGVKRAAGDINEAIKKSAETMTKELAYRMRGKK